MKHTWNPKLISHTMIDSYFFKQTRYNTLFIVFFLMTKSKDFTICRCCSDILQKPACGKERSEFGRGNGKDRGGKTRERRNEQRIYQTRNKKGSGRNRPGNWKGSGKKV